MENKKVLVVDDEAVVREVLRRYLTYRGYEVSSAENGPEAIARFSKERPGLILLDIMMPGMGGIEVLRKIKQINTETRVIVITGINDNEVGAHIMHTGAQDFITKPINFQTLDNSVLVQNALGS